MRQVKPVILVEDFKGFLWELMPGYSSRESPDDMVEQWMAANASPHEIRKYRSIPVPLFTDWWE